MSSPRRRAAARRRQKRTGSPQLPQGEPDFLLVGRLLRPHGLRGELLMRLLTDFPERLQPGVLLYLGQARQPLTIHSTRQHNKGLLIAFEEYEQREQAAQLRDQEVFVPAADRPALEEGEYYYHQLVGLKVVSEDQGELGLLAEIIETGANDVLLVRRPGGEELLLPASEEVLLGVDAEAGTIKVHLLPGLLQEK